MVDDAVRGSEYPARVPIVKVWTPEPISLLTVRLSPPELEVAKLCEATVLPFKLSIVPPAPPASTPQVNVPLVHKSFSVAELHEVKFAP